MIAAVLAQYGLHRYVSAEPIGSGLINTTWLVNAAGQEKYVLQRINGQVFRHPGDIAANIRMVGSYLQQHYPDYLFTQPLPDTGGADMVHAADGWYRLFRFIEGSHTVDVVQRPEQAYEAACQFARFTKKLSGFDAAQLAVTLPGFHNLPLRWQQYEAALQHASGERLQASAAERELVHAYRYIVPQYEALLPQLKQRVAHHDTKISNVLFDAQGRGLCVIDLDTVMPGFFTSDAGDMLRTYLCPVSEEEADFEKIMVRREFYEAVEQGYCDELGSGLAAAERNSFLFSGKMMVYMQALRFLTDWLNNDVYYGARYERHNLVRAGNQLTLLQRLMELAQ